MNMKRFCFWKKEKKEFPLGMIAVFQALGLVAYCGLVGLLIWRGNKWFGPMTGFLGPLLFLSLFVVSALICALIGLGHPFLLFWEGKKPKEALKLVTYTAAWLALFVLSFIVVLLVF